MAGAHGRENSSLSDRLLKEPYAFDFFQAVRVLQHLAREQASDDARRPAAPVGQDYPPEQESVRFRSQPSLRFPSCTVSQVRIQERVEGGAPTSFAEMVVTFMGVTGPIGVLPYHYTALLLSRIRENDFSLRDFLDLFHHRAISLFFRTWTKYRLPFAYERSKLDSADRDDPITSSLYCLIGMGTPGLRGRLEVDDETLLYFSGHFSQSRRPAVVLEDLLADYFDLPMRVLQLQGQWLRLSSEEQTRMPGPANPTGLNNRLGVDVVVGERVWDIQSKFRVRVGPLRFSQFHQFLPDGAGLHRLRHLTRVFVGPEFDFDVQVLLKREEVPAARLGGGQGRLGWDSWVRTREFTHDADDAVFAHETRSQNAAPE